MLDTPALFATAYDNVGSSIYYALGIVRGARAPGSRTHFRESDASRPRR